MGSTCVSTTSKNKFASLIKRTIVSYSVLQGVSGVRLVEDSISQSAGNGRLARKLISKPFM
jgi:hypothetical protein